MWRSFVPPLSHFLTHFSLPTLYPVFVFGMFLHTWRAILAPSAICEYLCNAGQKDNLLNPFITKWKVCPFLKKIELVGTIMTAKREGSTLVCDEVIKDTWSAEQVHVCGKHFTLTPPVRSSQFPGPGVYVCGAITHLVPRLPLSAFCVLWPSPLPYSCCLRSFPLLWLEQMGVWGKRMEKKRWAKQLGWGRVLFWYGMEHVFIMAIRDGMMETTSHVVVCILLCLPTTLQYDLPFCFQVIIH